MADGEMLSTGDLDGRGRRRRRDQEFEEFFDAMWPRARAMAARMGLGREEAEDVGLDAMALSYDRWARVRDLAYRDAWTLKVTANLALRALKKRRSAPPSPASSSGTWAPSPEDEVTSRLALRRQLGGLPRRQRQVVVLRYLADLPETEVAQALGIDVGSVKQHASRGRAALHDALALSCRGPDHG